MKKKAYVILLALLMLSTVIISASCTKTTDESSDETTDTSSINEQNNSEPEEVSEMNQWPFGNEKLSSQNINSGTFVKSAETDEKYIISKSNGFTYIDVTSPLFEIGGITHPDDNNGEFYRLDASNKSAYSSSNASLANCTAGAQIRFRTDAASIVVKITLRSAITGMNHFTDRGVYGIDLYTGTGSARKYLGAQMQTFAKSPTYNEETVVLPGGMQEVLINLPLYGGIQSFVIGFPDNAQIGLPTDRAIKAPIAFYGSSITQGGCVSRPANMYSHILCRTLDADNMNLGFSGSAMGEQSIAEYIASRDISAFVMDYDFNSPTAQSLQDTHEKFFQTVRAGHPDIPIIFVTHPFYGVASAGDRERINIIKKTYDNAVAAGDKNVYFVDSSDFFPEEMRDLFAVDILHPNDLGNFYMAKAIYPILSQVLTGDK